jgi:Flp pilus assembly protein TadD
MGMVQGGQTAAGIRQMTTAVDKSPDNSGLALALAMTFMQQREPRKAIPVLRKALQGSPSNPLLLNALGAAGSAAGDLALARRSYEEAAAANPKFEPARLNLAKLDIAERKFDAASARLSAILKANPKSVEAMRESAQLEFVRGRNKEAQAWCVFRRT